jgi:Sec-independent protein secretion pathway component TatC
MPIPKFIRRSLLFYAGIVFICFAIFPIVFLYGLSLLVEQFVGKQTAARIERFWDMIGKPYEYLTRSSQ